MLSPSEVHSQNPNFRPRRRHRKSRNGCMECKRRRIKCDEMKPSCSRCILTRQDCIWPQHSPSGRSGDPGPLPTPSPRSAGSPSPSMERRASPPPLDGVGLSDADLYHHYLQHTSRTLTHNRNDHQALQIGMPTLALRSKTVYHALLALSAACLCCDMISKEDPPPDINFVHQALMTGYHHYNLASERIRELISRPDALKAEPLLAASPLLVPFATSSQQINHWISSHSTPQSPVPKPLSTTPRDVIVIMRGIKTTLEALDSGEITASPSPSIITSELPEDTDAIDHCTSLFEANTRPDFSAPPPPSRTHPMFPIIASTSQDAFAKLHERLESASLYGTFSNAALSACAAAFDVLSSMRDSTFSTTLASSPPASLSASASDSGTPQVSPWLRSFAARHAIPHPSEPLTRPFLTFLVQTPQAYLDLVLPLLDQRLEAPTAEHDRNAVIDLTPEQALALDIYAHWSILMFLVEDESWFIGKLPGITLAGMLNRYGDDFVGKLWPDYTIALGGLDHGQGQGQAQWWPKSMWMISREIGRYR
ncbi:Zn(II)2Cys6 transcription factor domain-containing protein [Aspergillus lucknowensis]|uniref:Zn(2)-C6 fungal-type domain-containing protein n=1 Tax=Aspergillus lucknowensis TaxID=176173 RepID=A0ABR4LP22_9EURO